MTTSVPPVAKKLPTKRTHHGDTVVDEYAWLAEKDEPGHARLPERRERLHRRASPAHLAELRGQMFAEIKDRTQETDLSVPSRKGGWWYYTRTVEGQQYGDPLPPQWPPARPYPPNVDRHGAAAAAARRSCSTATRSPRGTTSSRSAPSTSARTAAGWPTPPTSPATSGSPCGSRTWPPASCCPTRCPTPTTAPPGRPTRRTLFYLTVDDAWRPYRVWRHVIGAPTADDVIVTRSRTSGSGSASG